MVEDVEKLTPEAKRHSLCESKLALNGKVGLESSEAAQHVASEIALPSERLCKSCAVENLATRILRPIEHDRHTRVHVRTVPDGRARSKRIPTYYVHRWC